MDKEISFEISERIERRLRMTDDELINIKEPIKDNFGVIKENNLPISDEIEARLRQPD